jgi:hypothetical protein
VCPDASSRINLPPVKNAYWYTWYVTSLDIIITPLVDTVSHLASVDTIICECSHPIPSIPPEILVFYDEVRFAGFYALGNDSVKRYLFKGSTIAVDYKAFIL